MEERDQQVRDAKQFWGVPPDRKIIPSLVQFICSRWTELTADLPTEEELTK